MCGIIGVWSKTSVSEFELREAVDSLKHRGPDSQNFWISKNKNIALGHTRLSIIDLEGGIQPLYDKENEIYVVVNGEFYEYDKIREFLKEKGHRFLTNSDSEILIHLYRRYGMNCLKYLNGEFAFVLWDAKKQLMFAARDRFGIKPLFYTYYNGTFYIASEMKVFKKFSIPFKWDIANLNFSLIGQSLQTPFLNIFPVKPAHYMIINLDVHKEVRYWDLYFNHQDDNIDEVEYMGEFKDKLEKAVNIRLKADVPIAHCLSGGIDSTVILSLMAKKQRTIDCFSVVFPADKVSDESEYIIEVVNFLKSKGIEINLHTIEMTEDLIIENFEKSVWSCEYPIVDFPVCAQLQLSKLIRDNNYKVVMAGQGADEILGGYPWHMEDILEQQPLEKNFQENLGTFLSNTHQNNQLNNDILQKIKKVLGHNGTKIILANGMMANERVTVSNFNKIILNYLSFFAKQRTNEYDILSNTLYQDIQEFLPGIPLNFRSDRVEMGYSIEGRLPYLDYNVVELTAKIPSKLKINGTREKYLLYESYKNDIPEKVYKRKKKAFVASPIVSEKWFNFICAIIDDSKFKDIPVFDRKKVNSLLEINKDERNKYYMSFMAIANAYFLHKNFIS